jgi:invasion protein IalB
VSDRRMKRTRRGLLALCAALCLSAVALPSSAQAYEQNPYCNGVVAPLNECLSSGLHSWYRNCATTGYSGAAVCAYMWNAHNGVVRGGVTTCRSMHAENNFNRTADQWYNSRAVNANTQFSIVLVGQAWA